jgi:hypothetical protein
MSGCCSYHRAPLAIGKFSTSFVIGLRANIVAVDDTSLLLKFLNHLRFKWEFQSQTHTYIYLTYFVDIPQIYIVWTLKPQIYNLA